MIRLIVASNSEEEEIVFTEDLEANISDFISDGWSVDIDTQIEDLPSGFPLEHFLRKV